MKVTSKRLQILQLFPVPKFIKALSDAPQVRAGRYLNAGLIIFLDRNLLTEWRDLSATLENDVCWEQNALNLIGHGNPQKFVMLDSRVWNVHANLIRKVMLRGSSLHCDEQRSIFVHATSTILGDVDDSVVEVGRDGHAVHGFFRIFSNSALRDTQQRFLAKFIQTNSRSLRELGILRRPLPRLR